MEADVFAGSDLNRTVVGTPGLVRADLRNADLGLADLAGLDASGADLRAADLHGAHLFGTVLRGADLGGADLSYANLYRADLRDACLEASNFRGAWLGHADLSGTNLNRVRLAGAHFDRETLWPEGFHPIDHGAQLRDCAGCQTPLRHTDTPAEFVIPRSARNLGSPLGSLRLNRSVHLSWTRGGI